MLLKTNKDIRINWDKQSVDQIEWNTIMEIRLKTPNGYFLQSYTTQDNIY